MERSFTASRITRGNLFFPNRLFVDDKNVTFYKGKVFGSYRKVIALDAIASVTVSRGIFFSRIIIETMGSEAIEANGFANRAGRSIEDILATPPGGPKTVVRADHGTLRRGSGQHGSSRR